jgi:hypothetical protein
MYGNLVAAFSILQNKHVYTRTRDTITAGNLKLSSERFLFPRQLTGLAPLEPIGLEVCRPLGLTRLIIMCVNLGTSRHALVTFCHFLDVVHTL